MAPPTRWPAPQVDPPAISVQNGIDSSFDVDTIINGVDTIINGVTVTLPNLVTNLNNLVTNLNNLQAQALTLFQNVEFAIGNRVDASSVVSQIGLLKAIKAAVESLNNKPAEADPIEYQLTSASDPWLLGYTTINPADGAIIYRSASGAIITPFAAQTTVATATAPNTIETKYATATVTQGAIGVSSGDRLRRVTVFQSGPPITATTAWYNLSTGVTVALSGVPTNPNYDDDQIEIFLNNINVLCGQINNNIQLLINLTQGISYVETAAIGLGQVSTVRDCQNFKFASIVFNVAGLAINETVVAQMEFQNASGGLWTVFSNPQTFSPGVNSVRMGPFSGSNLRLRLVSCSNAANTVANISAAEWRLNR